MLDLCTSKSDAWSSALAFVVQLAALGLVWTLVYLTLCTVFGV